MLRKMPQRMAGSMPEVVKAVVVKLACAESSPLITSLLVVLAQLVHVSAQHFLDFLASQPGQGVRSSQPCLPCWMQHCKVLTLEIQHPIPVHPAAQLPRELSNSTPSLHM